MLGRVASLITSILILTLAYTNCGEFKSSPSKAVKVLSSTCVAKLRAATTPLAFAGSICADAANYECERRIFAPGRTNEAGEEKHCLSSAPESCVSVRVNVFDTSGAREGADPGAYQPGGEYNREEIQCWNKILVSSQVSVIHSAGDSVAGALESAMGKCRERSSP